MKTFFTASLVFLIVSTGFAKTSFNKSMEVGMDSLKCAKHLNKQVWISEYFAQVAEEYPNEWLPLYYSAMFNLIISFQGIPSQRDMLINKAQKQITQAIKLHPNESELVTLQGFLYQATIMVDPVKNGEHYAKKAYAEFARAMELDPKNPRPYYLKAKNIMYTPEQYGGGATAAYPIFLEARKLFENFKPKNRFYPNWGKEDCDYYAKNCIDK